jgi:hypothetical protein
MPSTDDLFPDGLRDVRYGEVLLLSESDGAYSAEVWNTLGLNDCPQEAWDALDAGLIAAERGALLALLNGPRRWTLDTIVTLGEPGERRLTRFGDIDMFLAAHVELGASLPDQAPYVERRITRDTIFRFKPGTTVHQITSRDRQRYVMQAYSHAVDPTQDLASLPELGSRLLLPEGWSFTTCVLDRTLDLLSTDGMATVVQDELQNTYQRIDAVSVAAMSGGA